ncbi:MAG: hypothetical protein ACKVX7_02170 [Planctomycetota bacterium]
MQLKRQTLAWSLAAWSLIGACWFVTPVNAQYILTLEDTVVNPGSAFAMPINGVWEQNVVGFSLSIGFSVPLPIQALTISIDGGIVGELNPEFVQFNPSIDQGAAIFAVLFEVVPPFEGITLPAVGFPLLIAELTGIIYAGTPESDYTFDFVDGLGTPPINNIFVVDYQSVAVDVATGGTLMVRDPIIPIIPYFVRGDVTMDGVADLADVIFHLNYTFQGGVLPACDDAADANDDGHPDISDAIFMLYFLFLDGQQPWPPFPNPGSDFTPDGLGCADPLYGVPM